MSLLFLSTSVDRFFFFLKRKHEYSYMQVTEAPADLSSLPSDF